MIILNTCNNKFKTMNCCENDCCCSPEEDNKPYIPDEENDNEEFFKAYNMNGFVVPTHPDSFYSKAYSEFYELENTELLTCQMLLYLRHCLRYQKRLEEIANTLEKDLINRNVFIRAKKKTGITKDFKDMSDYEFTQLMKASGYNFKCFDTDGIDWS